MCVHVCMQCVLVLSCGYIKWCQNVIERMNKMKSFYNSKPPTVGSFLNWIRNDSLGMFLQ